MFVLLFGKINPLSNFFHICKWIVRASTVINLIYKNGVTNVQHSFTTLINTHFQQANSFTLIKKHTVRDKTIFYHIHQQMFSISTLICLDWKTYCRRWNNSWRDALKAMFKKLLIIIILFIFALMVCFGPKLSKLVDVRVPQVFF